MKNSNINFFTKLALVLITGFQKTLLRTASEEDIELYLKLAKLHFKLYFKKNLKKEAEKNSKEFKRASDRHTGMVIALKYKDYPNKKHLADQAHKGFKKLILN